MSLYIKILFLCDAHLFQGCHSRVYMHVARRITLLLCLALATTTTTTITTTTTLPSSILAEKNRHDDCIEPACSLARQLRVDFDFCAWNTLLSNVHAFFFFLSLLSTDAAVTFSSASSSSKSDAAASSAAAVAWSSSSSEALLLLLLLLLLRPREPSPHGVLGHVLLPLRHPSP